MPLDAVCLKAVVRELRPRLLGARIDKVQQPARDEIILSLRGNLRLLLNAGANQPRIHFTAALRENPAAPPMFCMLLRKHLIGARILSVEQPDLERVVVLTLHATDELGQSGERKLILELMGRRANLILLDGDGRIVDCMRRAALDVGGTRALLPGMFYRFPEPLCRISPMEEDAVLRRALMEVDEREGAVDAWLVGKFLGLSPLIAREIVFAVCGETDVCFSTLHDAQKAALADRVCAWAALVRAEHFTPMLAFSDGQPADFTYCTVCQYGERLRWQAQENFSALLDKFYDLRERRETAQRRGRELLRTVNTAYERLGRKADTMAREYAQTQQRDTLRLCGDLITANLYRMETGLSSFTAENYYEEGNPPYTVTLDPLLTPQQNAAKYYKKYNKAKSAEIHLREQIEKTKSEREYLQSVLQEIAQAESEQEFVEIRRELCQTGYLRTGKGKEKPRPFAERRFITDGGFTVLVGRSNLQNDQLTKKADRRDIWLHTQKIHGSHVVLCTNGAQVPPHDIEQAASLAAYFSQARGSDRVAVDYTAVKNVKKPNGARPGSVVYTMYQTCIVSGVTLPLTEK